MPAVVTCRTRIGGPLVAAFVGFDLSRAQLRGRRVSATLKEFKVLDLIHGYRTRGHLFTQNVRARRRTYLPTLDCALDRGRI